MTTLINRLKRLGHVLIVSIGNRHKAMTKVNDNEVVAVHGRTESEAAERLLALMENNKDNQPKP